VGLILAVSIKVAVQSYQNLNSMYNFYKNSKVCLAYMADVHRDASLDERSAKDVIIQVEFLKPYGLDKCPTFQTSRWFTRGWTLQELIAPTNVVFYDSGWQVIAKGTEHLSDCKKRS
jgi:hypothetical protein